MLIEFDFKWIEKMRKGYKINLSRADRTEPPRLMPTFTYYPKKIKEN